MFYLLALLIILLDQFTKWLIVSKMQFGQSITIINNVLYITSHRNSGAAWGILQGQMWLFYAITLIVIFAIIFYIQKAAKGKWLLGISLGLMLGGAIGNFIDRLFRKEVVDFIHMYIFGYNFPVFNVADSSLCIGVIILMIQMLLDDRKTKVKNYGENGTHHS